MRCAACGADSPPGAKFCGKCGARLAPLCCASQMLAPRSGPTFTDDPGLARLQPTSRLGLSESRFADRSALGLSPSRNAPRCSRKEVSVLFTDVCGFTGMAERLDPEETRRIIEAAFEVILDAVHGARGTVNQFLGDGVMALFDGALERDHAERAVSAALAILRDLQPLRDEVRAAHGLQFSVRIAVNTGPVVIGMIGPDLRDDYIAIGNTTQLATRLLAVAGRSGVFASATPFRHPRR